MDIEKIESLCERDQAAIRGFKGGRISAEALEDVQRENADSIRDFIARFGFPYRDTASEKAYESAFLAIQHSGDIELLDRAIADFSKAGASQIIPRDLAYMIDRSRTLKGQSQVYGTQYKALPDGGFELLPIEDIESVDARRGALGMESIDEYRETIRGLQS